MTNYDFTPCPTSELPRYSCHDCKHNLHGKPVPIDELTLGGEVIGPAHGYGLSELDSMSTRQRTVYAERSSTCDFPSCERTRINPGDPLIKDIDFGWVHSRHGHG